MNSEAQRQILWNVPIWPNVPLMYLLLLAASAVALIGVLRRLELISRGKADAAHLGRPLWRIWDLMVWALCQKGVMRAKGPAVYHLLIYLGFLALLFTTTMVLIDHDLGIKIYHGNFYLAVTIISDIFGLALIIGCSMALYRRYVTRPDLVHNRTADAAILLALILLATQGFLLEALRIHATDDPWRFYSPVGALIAQIFWPISARGSQVLHYVLWWFHTITVFACLALVPYSKFFHVLMSSANLFFRRRARPKGALPFPGDLEKMMESSEEFSIGLATIKDYTWKQLLDLDSCTSCGRCQEVCPAYNSGKALSPKWLILDSRNHALTLNAKGELGKSSLPEFAQKTDSFLLNTLFFPSSGLKPQNEGEAVYCEPEFRARNKLVQESALSIGANADARMGGEVLAADVFWSCTTCMACVEACPVGINHVDQIVENRRNMVLMQGELPSEAQATLRALENRGNPYGPPADRAKWLADLGVPILKAGDSVDYLYWVGCVSAYDPRKQKIARALVSIMQKAGISFGVLGSAEGCSGDPARRLGEENLFQTLAKKNIDTLRSLTFKTLVANCPHCFNTIKNEYPQLGNLGSGKQPEIIHHSVLLKRLLKENKISLKEGAEQEFTFHDPCYLGRYNDEYDAPRDSLKAVKSLRIVEMEKSREKGMCCGAGGGHFWMDMKVGQRVNVLRVEQAAQTGANKIATACPFCMQMMEDGAKLTNREEQLQVRDIAEVIAEQLE